MTYKHKHEKCATETKEILENILKLRKAEYDFIEEAKSVTVGNPMEQILRDESAENVLPGASDEILSEGDEVVVEKPVEMNFEDLENYTQAQEIESEPTKTKAILEKTKKRRNYIEFRDEYVKT